MSGQSFMFILIGIGLVVVVVQLVRYGGQSGAMFGSRSEGELGRVDGRGRGRNRVTVAVHALQRPTEARALGLHFTGRAAASVSRIGASLAREDARTVAAALEEAAAAAEQGRSDAEPGA